MNSTDNNDFSDFLHEQYKDVKGSVGKSLDAETEKYSQGEFIGEGAQKRVYKVYDHSCSREVAKAILKNDSPLDMDLIMLFQNWVTINQDHMK